MCYLRFGVDNVLMSSYQSVAVSAKADTTVWEEQVAAYEVAKKAFGRIDYGTFSSSLLVIVAFNLIPLQSSPMLVSQNIPGSLHSTLPPLRLAPLRSPTSSPSTSTLLVSLTLLPSHSRFLSVKRRTSWG